MKIDIITLFPKMFEGPFRESIIKRAQEKSLLEINIHDLRKWATDKRKTVDDHTYGGGPGMILRIDIIDTALSAIRSSLSTKVILLDATGKKFTQKKALQLSKAKHLILICGHYEGVDHRVHEHLVDEVISIGDYVLTGGEIPAMVIADSVIRLIPGVIKPESLAEESFSSSTSHQSLVISHHLSVAEAEYPQYTRPEIYHGWKVPKVLLSGNHKDIEKWRTQKASKKPQNSL